jgi:hypothetical protein
MASDHTIELVSVMELVSGDFIVLDNGEETTVRAVEVGNTKDTATIRLRGRPPIHVWGYWRRIVRRVSRKEFGGE